MLLPNVVMKFTTWNVRSLNDSIKRCLVRDFLSRSAIDIVGLQESKLSNPSSRKLRSIGGKKLPHWCHLDSTEYRGGVLVGWSDSFSLIHSHVSIFSVLVFLHHKPSNWRFTSTSVYAPTDRDDGDVCWWELNRVRDIFSGPWVLCGDFNTTLSSDERSDRNGSLRDINSFRDFISSASLIDLPLSGRSFTWSKKRLVPSMARLDMYLVCVE
ncbi:uncharacterized protein LOC109847740 [Asparagus officinalis]|uniref:uncharacterized protein LOC109847740 n=1 Tax=Asparagus officinalis TaxID=4686 RepID=UPI00098DE781|nr:uncharacterized protein LOC109847740 [Asparagus officinalis]